MGGREIAVASVAVALAGCLSGGPPPAGRQIVEGRGEITGMAFLDSPLARGLLVRYRSEDRIDDDLHFVTVADDDQAPVDRLLAERVSYQQQQVDARGRLVLQVSPDQQDPNMVYLYDLVLIDPATGARENLGLSGTDLLSPSGARLVYGNGPMGAAVRLREGDDQELVLGPSEDIGATQFLGEDLFYTTSSDSVLWRVVPGGQPVAIADGVTYFGFYGSTLILTSAADPTQPMVSVLDATTLERTALPGLAYVESLSPDGRWIVGQPAQPADADPSAPQQPASLLIERATGAVVQTIDPSMTRGNGEWRPGRDELWIPSYGGPTAIVIPGAPQVTIGREAWATYRPGDRAASIFALDGRFFFWFAPGDGVIEIGPADDPNGPFVAVNPAGSALGSFWELEGGRLLVEVSYRNFERADLIVLDPATGASRTIGEAGTTLAIGKQRVLAKLRIAKGAGDLVLIDINTGAQTKLAESVTDAVVEPGAGDDPLAPETHVAFQLENPIASPYDGIWQVSLP